MLQLKRSFLYQVAQQKHDDLKCPRDIQMFPLNFFLILSCTFIFAQLLSMKVLFTLKFFLSLLKKQVTVLSSTDQRGSTIYQKYPLLTSFQGKIKQLYVTEVPLT